VHATNKHASLKLRQLGGAHKWIVAARMSPLVVCTHSPKVDHGIGAHDPLPCGRALRARDLCTCGAMVCSSAGGVNRILSLERLQTGIEQLVCETGSSHWWFLIVCNRSTTLAQRVGNHGMDFHRIRHHARVEYSVLPIHLNVVSVDFINYLHQPPPPMRQSHQTLGGVSR
jgi:hypothetical protein